MDGHQHLEGHNALAEWFSIGRASWLTIPRVLLEAMPDEWQGRLAALLNEYDEHYPNMPEIGTRVLVTDNGRVVKTPPWLLNYRHPNQTILIQLMRKDHATP
ncbi:hypothetical protein C2134_02770 [Chromobacterium sinusclupearum]|uniref:Uncharacterized protein n=2 Tax=Chromobacterium sinusclupearum TaxID=2077146 RepID=A0A2K4MSQ2_9NEIS|nr:hypothetical protein C2134_02770 [Chromobacterium sinusclupearum]